MNTPLLSIGQTAKLLGISHDTLRRWDKKGKLSSVRSGIQGHRYYRKDTIDLFLCNPVFEIKQWARASKGFEPQSEWYCKTRDVFQARLEHVQKELNKTIPPSLVALITAVAGEIGNNSFDHNLGNWPDVLGIYFLYNMHTQQVILADRGQGILTTLKRVKPELRDDQEALRVAFSETISGRAPEARGNGLKFVRSVIASNSLFLVFQTGNAVLELKQKSDLLHIKKTEESIPGCFAVIGLEGQV